MNKIFKTLSVLAIGLTLLTGCTTTKNAKSYYIDSNNNLIVVYDDSTESNLGSWGESIIESLGTVTISSDGYYVINGVKTQIKAKVPASYTIDANGHLIVTYTDGTSADLGNFSETLVNGVQTIEISEDGYYVINGVKTNIKATEVYTVSFNTGFSKTLEPQKVKDGYKVTRPEIDRTGYTLDGWYCNGEEWRFNSDVVKNNMTLKAEWTANEYTVSFLNEKGTNPESMTAVYDSNVSLPSVSSVDGYTFDGWYNGTTKVSSGKWTIASDVTLNAKWTTNEYTITLNPGVGSVSKNSVVVKYGESFKLPIPTNSYGTFTGWLHNGEPFTDSEGNSLKPWTYTENITVTVDWIIHLNTVDDLQKLNQFKSAVFSLDSDIDISDIEWSPIGNEADPFIGTINGNNHKIKGLTITTYNSNVSNYGFIGTGNGLTINNLILDDVNIELSNVKSSIFVGAFVGKSRTQYNDNSEQAYGIIDNCSVTGSIEVKAHSSNYASYIGGISGRDSVVKNSINNAVINGHSYASGIIGQSGKAINCKNNGDVSANYASGICYTGISTSCCNNAVIDGIYSGGITIDGTAEQCLNTGNINGVSYAGGIGAFEAKVKYCVNEGTIQCDGCAGGLLGYVSIDSSDQSNTCSNSCNRGNVTGNTAYGIGGIQSYNCYNSGNVTATGNTAYGIGSFFVQQSASFGKITATQDSNTYATSACLISGYESIYFVDCYYGGESANASNKYGTETSLKYEKELYVDLMYWEEFNSETKTGQWNFSTLNYPKLWWED